MTVWKYRRGRDTWNRVCWLAERYYRAGGYDRKTQRFLREGRVYEHSFYRHTTKGRWRSEGLIVAAAVVDDRPVLDANYAPVSFETMIDLQGVCDALRAREGTA